jgi:carbon storage regulator CsrA
MGSSLPEPWSVVKGMENPKGGGQGEVFCVERPGDAKRYALKRLLDPNRAARFDREVDTMKKLHMSGLESVPPIVDSGTYIRRKGGKEYTVRYYVMPWSDEGSLDSAVDHGRYRNDPIAGLSILIMVGKALADVHAHGVAHRDIKPGNIVMTNGKPWLVDFGLAMATNETRMTGSIVQIGSRFYLAPEYATGFNEDDDHRPADFYAFAKVAWALLAGRTPPDREVLLTGRWRIEEWTKEPRLAALSSLFADMLKEDLRARLSDWRTVLAELHDIRRLLVSNHMHGGQNSLNVVGVIKDALSAGHAATDRERVAAFVRQLLQDAADRDILSASAADIGWIADAVGHLDRGFLYARCFVHEVVRSPDLVEDPTELFESDLGQLFERAVRRIAATQPAGRVLLTTLAFARGRGLPLRHGIWPVVATAIAGATEGFAAQSIEVLTEAAEELIETAGPYVRVDVEYGHTVFRLAHSIFSEYLLTDVGPEKLMRWRRAVVDSLFAAVRTMVADPYLAHHLSPYLVNHLAGHVAEADAWAALGRALEVLDYLDPGAIAEQVLGASTGGGDWPNAIVATVGAQHLLAEANPAGRPLIRAVETARRSGIDPSALADTRARPAGAWHLAWARVPYRPPHLRLPGSDGNPPTIAAFPMSDGHWVLAVGADDGAIHLWNPLTGRRIGDPLVGHTKRVSAFATVPLPNGQTVLASGGEDHVLWLWDLTTWHAYGGAPLARNVGVVRALAAVPESGDRTLLAQFGERTDRVRLWDTTTGRQVDSQIGRGQQISALTSVAMSDGSTLLAVGSRNNKVSVWKPTGENVGELTGHGNRVHALVSLPMPGGIVLLASYAWDNTVRIWDPASNECVATYQVTTRKGRVNALAAVRVEDGKTLLATAGDDNVVQLRDVYTGEPVYHPFTGHDNAVTSIVSFGLDEGPILLATGDRDGTVCVWSPKSQALAVDVEDDFQRADCLTVVPMRDGSELLASAGADHGVSLWDPATGEPAQGPLAKHPRRLKVLAAARGPKGRVVLVSDRGSSVRLWDPVEDLPVGREMSGHDRAVTVLATVPMPDGIELLASGSADHTVRLWDLTTGQLARQPFGRHLRPIRALAALSLPTGRVVLASCGDDNVVRLWDLVDGQVEDLTGHVAAITALAAVSVSDGVILASGSADGTVRLWRLNGEGVSELASVQSSSPVVGLAMLPVLSAGPVLAVAGESGSLQIVAPTSGHVYSTVSLGVHIATVVNIDSRLIIASRHGMFALDFQDLSSGSDSPNHAPLPLKPARSAARHDPRGDEEVAEHQGNVPLGRPRPFSGTRWPVALSGVEQLRDEHLDVVLELRGLDPDLAADVRRWLRVALTHSSSRERSDAIAIRRLLRHLGQAAIAVGVHSCVATSSPDLENWERIQKARGLIHPMCTEIARRLLLDDKRLSDEEPEGNAVSAAAMEDVVQRVLGVLSLNQLHGVLSSLTSSAYDTASQATKPGMHRPDVVEQLTGHVGTPSLDVGTRGRRHPLPRSTIRCAAEVARLFSLPAEGGRFQQALVDPSWSPDGDTPVQASHSNAALATLGAFVTNDLYARTTVQAMLSRPQIDDATPSHGVELAALVTLFGELDLRSGFLFTSRQPMDNPDTEMMADAVQAVLAAAYLSYDCNTRRFIRKLPECVQQWLHLSALSVHPGIGAAVTPHRSKATSPAPPSVEQKRADTGTGQTPPRPKVYRSRRGGPGGLVLSRTPGEKIMLGDDVVIEVLQIVQNKVRLRIRAPESLPVKREEIWDGGT